MPALGLLLATASLAPAQQPAEPHLDAPYVPTPVAVVSAMLELARPTPADTVYDLGSGDGRLVITAAERYGAAGVGVEIQEHLNERARDSARAAGVNDRVRFVDGDLFEVDLSPATVLTLYLGRRINQELRPRILRQMRPGSRVVSHAFDMGPWKADRLEQMHEELALVFLWVVPAHVAGRWRVDHPSLGPVSFRLDQRFQELRVVEPPKGDGARSVRARDPAMRGDSVWLSLVVPGPDGGEGRRIPLVGVVDGDRMSGSSGTGEAWTAVRTSGADEPLEAWTAEEERAPAGSSAAGAAVPSSAGGAPALPYSSPKARVASPTKRAPVAASTRASVPIPTSWPKTERPSGGCPAGSAPAAAASAPARSTCRTASTP